MLFLLHVLLMPYLGCKKGIVFQVFKFKFFILSKIHSSFLHLKYEDNRSILDLFVFNSSKTQTGVFGICFIIVLWDVFPLNLNRVLEIYLIYIKTINRRDSTANHRHGNLQLLKFSCIDSSWHHVLALLKHGSSWWRMQGGALLYTRMRKSSC